MCVCVWCGIICACVVWIVYVCAVVCVWYEVCVYVCVHVFACSFSAHHKEQSGVLKDSQEKLNFFVRRD